MPQAQHTDHGAQQGTCEPEDPITVDREQAKLEPPALQRKTEIAADAEPTILGEGILVGARPSGSGSMEWELRGRANNARDRAGIRQQIAGEMESFYALIELQTKSGPNSMVT
uniref:Uncharacterized protein n=1 Tax=Candidatus Kentrum sp. FW TaxID=2126338 RepID=A0A450SV42_9GAMM|nr:MAG: hypothetical protein BECKFW1821B_GA0114236_103723 [Candidatus Kentron sp. FW]